MAKIYFKTVTFILLLILIIGWILPFLFSAKSDSAVIVGILIIVFGAYLFYLFAMNIIKNIKNKFSNS